jgi:hypothetical protein
MVDVKDEDVTPALIIDELPLTPAYVELVGVLFAVFEKVVLSVLYCN